MQVGFSSRMIFSNMKVAVEIFLDVKIPSCEMWFCSISWHKYETIETVPVIYKRICSMFSCKIYNYVLERKTITPSYAMLSDLALNHFQTNNWRVGRRLVKHCFYLLYYVFTFPNKKMCWIIIHSSIFFFS